MIKKYFPFILFCFLESKLCAQLVVSNAPPYNSVNYLVQNVLLGTGVQVSNITFTGGTQSIGWFNGQNTNIGLNNGIIIATGPISMGVGPNNSASAGQDNGLPGDNDLAAIVSPNMTFNASVLEFDFIPTGDTVKFRFVFASEEYPEYTCCQVNDVFGFFISGPGISGPYSNNAANIALIPSTTTPIQINTVNGPCASVSYCDLTNPCCNGYPQYYVDNSNWTNPPSNTNPNAVQYDGFTTVLTAISPVQCGQQYHIKIAISDVGDGIFDSGVFLEAGSLTSSGGIQVSSQISYGNLNDSTLYEGCGQACIIVTRDNTTNQDTVVLSFSGTAINGVDITQLPDTIFFTPGQDSVVVCIQAINDALNEGLETLNLLAVLLGNQGSCSKSDSSNLSLFIGDLIPLSVTASNDTAICPNTSVNISASSSGGVQPVSYTWAPATGLSNATIANPVATPVSTTTYVVTVKDSCGVTTSDFVVVSVLPPGPVIASVADAKVCLDGTPVSLSVSASGGAIPYSYFWTTVSGNDSVLNPNSSVTTVVPTGPGTFLAVVYDFCGNVDSAIANVQTEDCVIVIPNVISADGDGQNDHFVIKNLDKFPGSRLVIFDRWGIKLYDNPDYQNNWDAHGYSDGTYYYVLYRSDNQTFPGFITVVRK